VTKYVSPPHITRGIEEIHLSPFFQLSFPAERARERERERRCVLGAVCVFVVLAWLEIAKVAGHDRKIIRLVIVHTNETHFGKRKKFV
jgi:hypothetical protein